MTEARLEELIQAQLDGELSAADRAELARLALRNADARRLHDQFLRTDRLLREVPAADPPPGLREAILAGSAGRARTVAARSQWQRFSASRIAAAILAALVIGGFGYLLSDGRAPGTELQGSLGAARGPEKAGTVTQPAQAALRAEGVVVSASLRRDGARLQLELGSSASFPCEVGVKFDSSRSSYAGGPGDAPSAVADGELALHLPAGSRVTRLDFSGASPIQLELRAGGRVLGETMLSVSDP